MAGAVFSHCARLNRNCHEGKPEMAGRVVDRLHGAGCRFVSQSALSMPKFFIKTYGCQMNERDSEQVAHSLLERGYERAARETEADVVLLNTCSVRDMAEQKGAREDGNARAHREAPAGSGLWFSRLHGAGAGRRSFCRCAASRSRGRNAKIPSRRRLRRRASREKTDAADG